MDLAALFALLVTAYEAHRAHKAATGDDNSDAVIDTILPELAKYFTSLFKGDTDSFFAALNGLVLGLYHISGDAFQLLVRLMVNMKSEKLQSRHPWISLPLLVFLKGYFGALEEATKGKDKPTAADIKAATEKVAAEAKKAASDLGSKFNAAKEAVKGMHIPGSNPNPPPPGGPVPPHAPHAPPSGGATPAAGGTGNKKSWGERFGEVAPFLAAIKTAWADAKDHIEDAVDGAEEVAKNLAYALIGVVTAMVITGLVHGIIAVKAPEWVWAVTVVFTLVWGLLPLFIGFISAIKAKSGFAKLGSAVTAILLTGGVSSLVIATIDGFAVLSREFSWVYVASGLAAIVIADFIWRLGDMFGDAAKALIRAIPDSWEADWMQRGTIGFRKAMFTIAVAYSAFMFLVGLYAQWEHTLYGVGAVGMLVLCLLMAAYGYSRVSLTVNDAAADLSPAVSAHRIKNLERFYWAATGLSLALLIGTLVFNALVPPCSPNADGTPNKEAICSTGELPSYAERWQASRLRKAGASLGNEVVEVVTPAPTESTCSPQVVKFVEGIRKGDCQVILKESSDTTLLSLCNQAEECGATKPVAVRKVGPRDAGFNWWWFAVPAGIAAVLGLAWIGREDPEKKKKEEGKKPAAH